jgi:hypothetical protein
MVFNLNSIGFDFQFHWFSNLKPMVLNFEVVRLEFVYNLCYNLALFRCMVYHVVEGRFYG